MLKGIKIIAKEKETKCAPCFVIWVMLLWVATSCCYDMLICFDAGVTEKPRFDLNIITILKTFSIFMQCKSYFTTKYLHAQKK